MRHDQAVAEYKRHVELLRQEVVPPYDSRLERFSLSVALVAVLYWLAWVI